MERDSNDQQHQEATRPSFCDSFGLDLRKLSFPSDALSIGRLRKIFPEHFDTEGAIRDRYIDCDFFSTVLSQDSEYLDRLYRLLGDERTMAASAFYERLQERFPDQALDSEERDVLDRVAPAMEGHYQYFKLADSPETARLLIEQVKSEGEKLAIASLSRSR